MALKIETGVGVRGANSYVSVSYITNYLTARNRSTQNNWASSSDALKEAAAIAATDYVDKRFYYKFLGLPKVSFQAMYAEGAIVFSGLPDEDETFTLGDETYTFVSALTGEPNEILIGTTAEETALNVEAAVNAATIGAAGYGAGTPQNRHATAATTGGTVALTATAPGSQGDLTILSGTVTNATLTAFTGGVDGGLQNLCWPRTGAYDERGVSIDGIPDRLKQAVAEYAVRALASGLLPDPSVDPYSGSIKRRLEKIGPITEEYEYLEGTTGNVTFIPYPSADRLLMPLISSGKGRVIRA